MQVDIQFSELTGFRRNQANPKKIEKYARHLLCGILADIYFHLLDSDLREDRLARATEGFFLDGTTRSKELLEELMRGTPVVLEWGVQLPEFPFQSEKAAEVLARRRWPEDEDSKRIRAEWLSFFDETKVRVNANTNHFLFSNFEIEVPRRFVAFEQTLAGGRALILKQERDTGTVNWLAQDNQEIIAYDGVWQPQPDSEPELETEVRREIKISAEEFFNHELLIGSDEEQKAAIQAGTDQHCVILAGAGSGKTRTLVNRLAYLHLVRGIPLSRILLVTYTRNAAQEMAGRAEKIIRSFYGSFDIGFKADVNARTFDAFLLFLVKRYWRDMGFVRSPEPILSGTRSHKMLRMLEQAIQEMDPDMAQDISQQLTTNDLAGLMDRLDKRGRGVKEPKAGLEVLYDHFLTYQFEKCSIAGFTFISHFAWAALENSPVFREVFQSLFDVVLVDEFQDIDQLQFSIFKHLLESDTHLTFVGDDDQSIYGFRGSSNEYIKELTRRESVTTYKLLTNYRNNPYIVRAANSILARLPDRVKGFSEIRPYKKFGSRIKIAALKPAYPDLANEVLKLIRMGIGPANIAVLARSRRQVQLLKEALSSVGIPISGQRLEDPNETLVYIFYSCVCFWLDYNQVQATEILKKELNLEPVVNRDHLEAALLEGKAILPKVGLDKVVHFGGLHKHTSVRVFQDLVDLFSLRAAELFEGHSLEKIEDEVFELFEEHSNQFAPPWPCSEENFEALFRTFLEKLPTIHRDKIIDGVQVSTIHKAKGLEYDAVLITGLSMGAIPNTKAIDAEYERNLKNLNMLANSQLNYQELRRRIRPELCKRISSEARKLNEAWRSEHLAGFMEAVEDLGDEINDFRADDIDDYCSEYEHFLGGLRKSLNQALTIANDELTVLEGKWNRNQDKARNIDAKRQLAVAGENEFLVAELESRAREYDDEAATLKEKLLETRSKKRECNQNLETFRKKLEVAHRHYQSCQAGKRYLEDIAQIDQIQAIKNRLLDQRNERVREETRVFYVALTRAREYLYLCYDRSDQPSEFIEMLDKSLSKKIELLTSHEEEELARLNQQLKSKYRAIQEDPLRYDKQIDQLLNATRTIQEGIKNHHKGFMAEFCPEERLPAAALSYFYRASGLVYLLKNFQMNLEMEIAHNFQRGLEEYLTELAGRETRFTTTNDMELINRLSREINSVSKKGKTGVLGTGMVRKLFFDKQERHLRVTDYAHLKQLAIMHYVIRGSAEFKFVFPDGAGPWPERLEDPVRERLLVGCKEVANIRNKLIHHSFNDWPEDSVPRLVENVKEIVKLEL